jgi:hypothetical protein
VLPKRDSFGREFAFLTLLENRERIIGLRLGAAQQNISQVLLRGFECIKPSGQLVQTFSERTAPLFENILNLQRQTANLRRTRDLLLPRLLSGQVALAIDPTTIYDEDEFKHMVENGTQAWAGVPDSAAWVETLRGGKE